MTRDARGIGSTGPALREAAIWPNRTSIPNERGAEISPKGNGVAARDTENPCRLIGLCPP